MPVNVHAPILRRGAGEGYDLPSMVCFAVIAAMTLALHGNPNLPLRK
jgi:hypothetical protein